MIEISEREGKTTSRKAEADMKKSEDQQRAGYERTGLRQAQTPDTESVDGLGQITEEQRRRNLSRVGDILKSIGG